MGAALEAGFADPVFGAQGVFRAVMDALAKPGMPQQIAFAQMPPPPLTAELAAVALTLCDHDTPVWLDPGLMEVDAVREWLAFHTGAPLAGDPGEAVLALVSDAGRLPPIGRFAQGTDEYPDRSTTIVLALPALAGGSPLTLRGPGIRGETIITPQGLPAGFVGELAGNRSRFPRGVDLLLASAQAVIGLPRTTRVEG